MNEYHLKTAGTFENYQPATEAQALALLRMKRLAQQITEKAAEVTDFYGFKVASPRLYVFSGPPGTGKTHLLEALVRTISEAKFKDKPPVLYERPDLDGEDTSFKLSFHDLSYQVRLDRQYGDSVCGGSRLSFVDDLLGECQNLGDIKGGSWQAFKAFVEFVYTLPAIAVVTTNFRFEPDLFQRIEEVDQTGRLLSRLQQITYESPLDGEDYRFKLRQSQGEEWHF